MQLKTLNAPPLPRSQEPRAAEPDPIPSDAEGVAFFTIGDQDFAVVTVTGSPSDGLSSLSAAEIRVLAELIRGRTNREIADARGTSERTVTNQVSAVFKKLGVRSRSELALRFAGDGLPTGGDDHGLGAGPSVSRARRGPTQGARGPRKT